MVTINLWEQVTDPLIHVAMLAACLILPFVPLIRPCLGLLAGGMVLAYILVVPMWIVGWTTGSLIGWLTTDRSVRSIPVDSSVGAGDYNSSSIIDKMPGIVPPVNLSSPQGADINKTFQGALFIAQKTPDGYLNLRSGPGLQNPVVGRLPSGARGIMQVGETFHDTKDQIIWMPVRFGGVEGYVSANFLQPE
jgi:hypothetical protein